jgi:putative restriction endonuclease
MKLFIGVTDNDWFRFLRARNAEEMNFWRPKSTAGFSAIVPGELFLFKTRYPENRIVGGAFFVRHTTLPLDLAWSTFGDANGVDSLEDFRDKISSIRGDNDHNPTIGCTMLTQPFYLNDNAFLMPPNDWAPNIVMGKSYDATIGEGLRLYQRILLEISSSDKVLLYSGQRIADNGNRRYGDAQTVRPRLGQGGFRVSVLDEYERRCAITGEKTLPVLQAAHIKPYSKEGPHAVSNGLLLRSDLHTLFDRGYMTVTNDLRVKVSRRIREEFSNGRDYYALDDQKLKILPEKIADRPDPGFLEWHHKNCFLG